MVHRPYGLPSSGLGVWSNSLARLTYSHGIPRESTLSSRPASGMSVGLCSDVKLVSRQSRCGGVPARLPKWYLVGLDGDSRARISCSCSSSSWTSAIVWCSRAASDDDASVEDASRCGFAGPRVVTTWHDVSHDVGRGYSRVSRVTEGRETTGTNHASANLSRASGSPLANISLSFTRFQFSASSRSIIKCHVKIKTKLPRGEEKKIRIRYQFAISIFYVDIFVNVKSLLMFS